MSAELKKVRKGTKSCTECRRRKVRCTWTSDDAPVCRRCEERGSTCVAQIFSPNTPGAGRLTSRDRISRLEKQVATLSKALRGAESRDAEPKISSTVDESEQVPGPDSGTEDEYESDSNDDPDVLVHEPPRHFNNIFDNELITSDGQAAQLEHKKKVLGDLSIAVRTKLQHLIPAKREIETIAPYATQWLTMFHSLFPAPRMIRTGEEMIEQFDVVRKPDVDPCYLASWLVTVAMTVQQVPKDVFEKQFKRIKSAAQFQKSVSDAVEVTIMRQDAMVGTVDGIETAMLFLRLQLSRAHFKKTWVQLRRIIAIAELIGLHRSTRKVNQPYQAPKEGHVWPEVSKDGNHRKAQLWESLCSIDRIAGMMFGLPQGTRRYNLPQQASVMSDGQVILRAFLGASAELAMKVQDLDDIDLTESTEAEVYASVLKIDGELRVIHSVTPASWWQNPRHLGDHFVQFWHYYITIRVHLPFTLRRDTSEQYAFSRLACMKACQTLALRYLTLRPLLPVGFFICRIVDLQAFTAVVVLLMAYHAASSMERANLHAQGLQPPELLVPQVVDYMRSVSNQPVSDFARRGVETITALCKLLGNDKQSDMTEDLVLKVPLIGKLHVRRNQQHSRNGHEHMPIQATTAQPDAIQSNADGAYFDTVGQGSVAVAPPTTMEATGPFSGDPLSWSIEDDHQGFFQDALMSEDFSPFDSWFEQSSMGSTSEFSTGT